MSTLKIYVGTMTGTAEYVAQAIQMDCADLVSDIKVVMMDNLSISAFDEADCLYLICTSTYGAGDVPDNAAHLYNSLLSEPKGLTHVRYGVIALGDHGSYPQTFANGGRRFDAALADLGAQRIGDIFTHDASSGTMPETEGTAWARGWLAQASATV
jgi:MioC protein